MSGDGGFLARWSKRKLDARDTAPPAAEPPLCPPSEPEAEGEPELSADEIARLPSLDQLTPHSDLEVFLRKGVPDLLRKAALRRMWELDPAIRDYVGDARDYAYDWNVLGGVPGSGPLLPTDEVGATLARMFDREPPIDAEVGEGRVDEAPVPRATATDARTAEAELEKQAPLHEEAAEEQRAARQLLPTERAVLRPMRRHGTAIPTLE